MVWLGSSESCGARLTRVCRQALKAKIDGCKGQYKDKFNRLRELKAEIEQIQVCMGGAEGPRVSGSEQCWWS